MTVKISVDSWSRAQARKQEAVEFSDAPDWAANRTQPRDDSGYRGEPVAMETSSLQAPL